MLIRKFVGCVKVAALMASVLVIGLSTQTVAAGTATTESTGAASPSLHHTSVTLPALSPACAAAIQAIKDAFANDRAEDAAERAQQAVDPDPAADQAEDAAERAQFKALFAASHTACTAEIAAIKARIQTRTVTASGVCTNAVSALKAEVRALWTQGTRPTAAQWAQLRALKQAAVTACGWSWRGH
jgi:hypothetical protein